MKRSLALLCCCIALVPGCSSGHDPGVRREANGRDARASISDKMQRAAETALGAAHGVLIAVDPRTGGIRALAASDPKLVTSPHPPGSTFKIITAAAALKNHVLGPRTPIRCPAQITIGGRRIRNYAGLNYGSLTFERAFAVSCNTAFAQIGVATGAKRLLATARALGFRVGRLDRAGTITPPSSRGDLAAWSFGAAGSRVSPLQLSGIASAIARGGTSLGPSWTDLHRSGKRVLRESTADELVRMMEGVVESGTGRNAALPGVRIAGKTGTADPELSAGRSDAWFVGLLPSRRTRLVAVGYLPGAGIGGERAALLVRTFFARAL